MKAATKMTVKMHATAVFCCESLLAAVKTAKDDFIFLEGILHRVPLPKLSTKPFSGRDRRIATK